MGGKDSGVS